MTAITIRLTDDLYREVEAHAKALHMRRAQYIREAIELMNKKAREAELKEQLTKASLKVRENSMRVNKEFSEIEDDPED